MSSTNGSAVPHIAYVLGTYPVPTTTFIDREIAQLRALNVDVRVVSIRRPNRDLSRAQAALQTHVTYVTPAPVRGLLRSHASFLGSRPLIYLRTFGSLVTRPHPSLTARVRTVGHFGLAVHVARLLRDGGPVDHVHAHFVDRAALIALVVGRLLDRPYSATAHANDIYVGPVLLPEKIAGAKFVATCTRYNERYLHSVPRVNGNATIHCIYHGLDLDHFEPAGAPRRAVPLLLSIAQLKEKKGLIYLLEACALLAERGVAFDCQIAGDGPLREDLQARTEELGLRERVRFLGAVTQDEVIARYAEAAVFVLPCITASDGDRDGIPNVILEAMAMGLPVVSTEHSGIPEAVQDGRTGILVPPRDAVALADALVDLLANPERREALGRAGRERVTAAFDVRVNVHRLLEEFVG